MPGSTLSSDPIHIVGPHLRKVNPTACPMSRRMGRVNSRPGRVQLFANRSKRRNRWKRLARAAGPILAVVSDSSTINGFFEHCENLVNINKTFLQIRREYGPGVADIGQKPGYGALGVVLLRGDPR